MIVVVGGDGTMNEVVDGIVPCDMVTLGYIPVGTGSDLARGLRLSRRPMRGLRRIFKARRIRQIDYGVIAYGDDVLRHRRFIVSADRAGCGSMPAYAAFGDQKYLQPDSSAAIVVPDTRIYTVFEGETDPGYILLDGTRRVNLIIFILSVHDSTLRGRRILVCAEGGQQRRRQPGGLHCQPCLEAAGAWNPARGVVPALPNQRLRCFSCREVQIYGTPDGSSRGRRKLSVPDNLEVRCIERKLKIVG